MKRLLIITLTVCSYSYISTEGWLTNRLNRFDTTLKHYIPGPYSSINTLPHKDIASRIASMRYLYGPEVTPYQEELINNHLQQNVKNRGVEPYFAFTHENWFRNRILKREQKYAKPWSFWQYQHPDRFEY